MANFTFHCPYCNQKVEALDEWRGLEVSCPNCNASMVVPDEKLCPKCGKTIKREAVFCRWCKQNIQEIQRIACKCPQCGEVYQTKETDIGNEIVCPVCEQTVIVKSQMPVLKKYHSQGTGRVPKEFGYNRQGNSFIITGSYPVVFALIEDSIVDSFAIIKKEPERGLMIIQDCKSKFVKVYFIFSQKNDQLLLELKTLGFETVYQKRLCSATEAAEYRFYEYVTGKKPLLNSCTTVAFPPEFSEREDVDYTDLGKQVVLIDISVIFGSFIMMLLIGWLGCIIAGMLTIGNIAFAAHAFSMASNSKKQYGLSLIRWAMVGSICAPVVSFSAIGVIWLFIFG